MKIADRRRIIVTIGRYTLLALARGEAVHLNEVYPYGVVTLIRASDYPAALLLKNLAVKTAEADEHIGRVEALPDRSDFRWEHR